MYADLFMLLRQARNTYRFLFYVNADERRNHDPHWNSNYTFVSAPLVRQMIDDLYNITMLLEDPWIYGPLFRKSGYRKIFLDLSEDEARYGTQEKWSSYIQQSREKIRFELRTLGLTEEDVMDKKEKS